MIAFCGVYTRQNCEFNKREFFRWRGEFCHFKTGIPGGPGQQLAVASRRRWRPLRPSLCRIGV